jgi:hypothetical protein
MTGTERLLEGHHEKVVEAKKGHRLLSFCLYILRPPSRLSPLQNASSDAIFGHSLPLLSACDPTGMIWRYLTVLGRDFLNNWSGQMMT